MHYFHQNTFQHISTNWNQVQIKNHLPIILHHHSNTTTFISPSPPHIHKASRIHKHPKHFARACSTCPRGRYNFTSDLTILGISIAVAKCPYANHPIRLPPPVFCGILIFSQKTTVSHPNRKNFHHHLSFIHRLFRCTFLQSLKLWYGSVHIPSEKMVLF